MHLPFAPFSVCAPFKSAVSSLSEFASNKSIVISRIQTNPSNFTALATPTSLAASAATGGVQ